MNSTRQLLRKFQTLQLNQINQLSQDQMRQWLSSLHQSMQNGQPVMLERKQKTKYIHKIYKKTQFRKLIQSHMGSIMRRTLECVTTQNGTKLKETHKRESSLNGGNLKFKSASLVDRCLTVKRFNANINSALRAISNDELSCPICLELLICPALTSCGHTFCLQCLDESLLFSQVCPSCRENIKGSEPIVCPQLEKLVQVKVELQSSKITEYNHYTERVSKFKIWKGQRLLTYDKLVVGQMVDIRDTESIWCQGAIAEVYKKQQNDLGRNVVTGVLVHYNRWNKIYNQIIDIPSYRLAPLSCFSGRIDIPRYNLTDEDDNMRGSVITGLARMDFPFNFIQILESNEAESSQQVSQQGEENSHSGPQEEEQGQQLEEREQNEEPGRFHLGRQVMNRMRRSVVFRFMPNSLRSIVRLQLTASNSQQNPIEIEDSNHQQLEEPISDLSQQQQEELNEQQQEEYQFNGNEEAIEPAGVSQNGSVDLVNHFEQLNPLDLIDERQGFNKDSELELLVDESNEEKKPFPEGPQDLFEDYQ